MLLALPLDHVCLDMELSKVLDKMGETAITREEEEDDIGAAFRKFAIVTKELSNLMKNLVIACLVHLLKFFFSIFLCQFHAYLSSVLFYSTYYPIRFMGLFNVYKSIFSPSVISGP